MNKLLRYLSVMACVVLCSLQANAILSNLYSKVIVTSDLEGGLVYVSDKDGVPAESAYSSSMEKSQGKFEIKNSATHTYYIKAKVSEAMSSQLVFDGWYYGNNLYSKDVNCTIDVPTSQSDKNKPTTQSYRAHFIVKPAITLESDWRLTVKAMPESNKVGEEVTLTASKTKLRWLGDPLRQENMMYEFDHWEDENGNVLSYEPEFKYIPTAPIRIIAVGKDLSVAPEPGKYYRLRNMTNRVLKIEGNFGVDSNLDKDPAGGKGLLPSMALLRWALPTGHDYSKFVTLTPGNRWDYTDDVIPLEVEADPSTILYLTGKKSGTTIDNVSIQSQGMDTHALMNYYFTLKPMNEEYPGYYYFNVSQFLVSAGLKMRLRYADTPEGKKLPACDVYLGTGEDSDSYCAMALQPIDEEHMDRYWFGAKPDEALEFEGGYWSTMYTAFPYQCKDGVEAYYIKGTTKANGITYACLERVQGDKVPAATAVLLKCQGLTTKENRLIPLSPDTQIPALEGNLLKGLYQLYTDRDKNGRVNFDESTMRVLGVNSAGAVGFFKMKANEDGSAAELLANKAYLDLSSISPANVAAGYKLVMGDQGSTAIDSIESDDKSVKYENQPVYDLTGRQVANPEAGNIYIVDGKKIVWK